MQFAATIHEGQKRKETEIAYLSHLLSVSALVIENGGNETEAIAALQHDAIEDQGSKYKSQFLVEPREGRKPRATRATRENPERTKATFERARSRLLERLL